MNQRIRSILCLFGDGWVRRIHPAIGRIAATIALIGCSAVSGPSVAQPSRVTAAAEGDGNNVTVSDEGETVILDVQSRSGIGRATVNVRRVSEPKGLRPRGATLSIGSRAKCR